MSAAHDDDAESDAVTLIHTASGSDYGGVTANVTVNTVEDEQEALDLNQPDISLAEGAKATFTVVLASLPNTSVTVNLSAPQGSGLTFDKTPLTFSISDWQTAQTVTITSLQDANAVNENVDVRIEVGSGAYGADAVVLPVAVTDDDSVSIVLSDDSLSVDEGVTTSYTVRLATQPSETVTVDIGLPLGADITVLTHQLEFNANNWMAERTVKIVTRRDLDADVDPAITVTHTASNGDYDMITKALTVTVSEVDVRGLVFLDSDGGTVGASESLDIDEGDSTSYGVRLATQPSAQVVVTLPPGVGLSLNKMSLTFTSSDWIRAQTVTVTGSDDEDASNGAATIAHTSAGGGYDSVARSLEFVITDDDTAAIVLTDSTGAALATEGLTVTEGATASYRVQLATKPSATVTVAISGTASTDLTTVETSLTFTGMNWNTPQTVEVPAGHDDDAITDAKVTLSHVATGGEYDSVMADLAVVISEDDSDGFVITDAAGDPLGGDTLTVDEGSDAAYKISLSAEPAGTVNVTLSGTANTDLQLDKSALTFNATDWSTPQTVTATAVQDDDVVDDQITLVHTPSGAAYAAPVLSLNAVITDDDHQSVVLSVDSLEILEGGTESVGVSLGSVPTADVVVDLTLSMSADLELPTAELTFTPQNWNTVQDVSVVSRHDHDAVNDFVQIAFNAGGGGYSGVLALLRTVVTDDDIPSLPNVGTIQVMEGSSKDFSIDLVVEPFGTVTLDINGATDTGLTFEPSRLVYTVGNWNVHQTVTVSAAHDNDVDDETFEVTLDVSGGGYDNVSRRLTVVITDDDTAGITVSQTTLTVAEGGSGEYTIVLDTQPTADVTVTIVDPTDNTDATTTPNDLTFSSTDWSTAKTVTVNAAQDADAVNDTATVTHTVTSADTGYSAASANNVDVTITDNDTAGITVSRTTLTVAEGGSGEYTIVLNTQPTADVTVTIVDPTDNTDATTTPNDLTFSSTDWSTAKTVTVNAAQDADAVNDTATVTHTVTSADTGYNAASANNVDVTITDNDTAGITVSRTTLTVAEGGSGEYTIVLNTQPTADVTVTIVDPTDNTDATTTPNDLTFTSTDWSTAKTVMVNAAQDADAVNDTATVTHTVTSADTGYSAASANNVDVTITDNDTAGITVSRTTLTVAEGGSGEYTIVLNTQPTADVTVTIVDPTDNTDATTDPADLTFSSTDWSTAKTVTVNAAQDADAVNDTATVTHTVTSVDTGYSAASANNVDVTITDNDTAGITVSRTTLTVAEGGSGEYTIVLNTQPTADVTVTIVDPTDNTDATTDPADLTFSSTDWSTAKTVTVNAAQDADAVNDTATVTHTVTSADTGYSAASANNVDVTITDNDSAQEVKVSFEAGAYRVSEGGMVTVTVMLSTAPSQTTVIPITATSQGEANSDDYSGVPRTVAFNAGNTLTSFNFMATQDGMDENCECVLLTFGTLPSGVSAGSTDAAKVSIIDNPTPNGPPTVPPRPFDLTAYGGDQALYVRWEILVAEDLRAPVTSYQMRYRQVAASSWRNVSRANDGLSLWEDITGLTNRRAYEVQVAAVNRMGTGEWASVKATPQEPYAPPPGPAGDPAFDVGRLGIYWLAPNANHTNVLDVEYCTGSEDFRVIWTGPAGNRIADEWDVYIYTRRGAGEVSYSFEESTGTADGAYFAMNGTVNFEGAGALSLRVRARFGSTWGTWGPASVSLYCHEPEAPADPCGLQVQQQAVENTLAEGEPRIDGIPELGQTLSADTTAIVDIDGLNEVVFAYQWLADDAEINGATASTYTLADADIGKVIKVRGSFTDDGGNEEALTSAPTAMVTTAGLQLQSAKVDGSVLTLTYNEVLDTGVTPPNAAFAVNVNGDSRSLIGVGMGESSVLLLLSAAVVAGDTVTVDYTAPDGPDFIQDIQGRKAASFSGQAVTNSTASATRNSASTSRTKVSKPLTASAHDAPASHNGQDSFTFELRFSEDPRPDFSYTTVRNHAFTMTGGSVTYVRRLEPGKNVRWEITVAPGTSADVTLSLNATTDCSAQGAICTEDGGMLSGRLLLVVPGPNTPATGAPTITGTAQVGNTLTAGATGIADDDGLGNATFSYQWLADNAEINGANASTYTLADDDAGKAIKVKVSFTDDAGNDEHLTSAATGAVAAAVVSPPLTASVRNVPSSHNGQNAFTFEMRFSEDPKPDFSYTTVRDHAFTVTGGSVTYVRRLEPGKNVRWEITVTPDSSADVAIAINATTDCEANGAICTEDGRILSTTLEFTVNGPGQ